MTTVSAQDTSGSTTPHEWMVNPGHFEELLELRHFYQASPWFDGLVYLSVFTALVHLTLRRHFPKDGQALVALSGATGLALAVGASHAAERARFRIPDLGGFAWLVLGTAVLLVVLDLLRNLPRLHLNPLVAGSSSNQAAGPEPRNPVPDAGLDDVDTAQRVEESIHTLLCEAYDLVGRKKHLHRIRAILSEVTRRERIVQRLYKHILKQLAKRRWMMTRARRKLNPQLRQLMLEVTDNISDFERLVDTAQSAASVKNRGLLKESIERMIVLEEQSIQLTTWLRAAMQQPQHRSAETFRVGNEIRITR